MVFSITVKDEIAKAFEKRIPLLGERTDEILSGINSLTDTEQIAMKFLYANMPFNDIGDYDFSLFVSYVKHALFLMEKGPYRNEVSETQFLHYVLFHRSNNEKIEECRNYLYEQLYPRIDGLSMKDAALKVNEWCFEMATYQPTDRRTAGIFTLCKSGYGRCGEEAVLLVSALRSVGIPARLTFTPRWAHCDNNHAWVEMWCENAWYFTGACEPSAVLNQGWFTVPASRAMMINSTIYSDIGIAQEDILQKKGASVLLNNLPIYAKTTELTVKVVNSAGILQKGVPVSFEILNTGEFFPAAVLETDSSGCVRITTGLGGIYVRAGIGEQKASCIVDTRKETFVTICTDQIEENEVWTDFVLPAPVPHGPVFEVATKEQEEEQNGRNDKLQRLRIDRIQKAYDEAYALRYCDYAIIEKALKDARGNFSEIKEFLETDLVGAGLNEKAELLTELAEKDLTDVPASLLLEHLKLSLPYREKYEDEIYRKYVLCPRIAHEELTRYRSYILETLTDEEKSVYRSNPKVLWDELDKKIKQPGDEVLCQLATPIGTLKLQQGILLSKRILYVAILRTLGIPSRLNPADRKASYFTEGKFVTVERELEHAPDYSCNLKVIAEGEPSYYTQWTLARRNQQGDYLTLYVEDQWKESQMDIALEEGDYRVLTVDRMSNGDLLAKSFYFNIKNGASMELRLEFPEIKPKDLIRTFTLPNSSLQLNQGEHCSLDKLTAKGKQLFLFLDPGKEPTEHILREMIEHKDTLGDDKAGLHIILSNERQRENHTLQLFQKEYEKAQIYLSPQMELTDQIVQAADILQNGLPLVLVTDGCLKGVYAVSGYNVGSADFIHKVLQVECEGTM
ncbi:MAG: hypothetical protein K0S47_2042 [Herbinix sp.]|jgi:hypothetical protein|nr:hypothetical protein [Herbinix sp.]